MQANGFCEVEIIEISKFPAVNQPTVLTLLASLLPLL